MKPTPIERDIRICFAIAFFATEADATAYADATKGATYNGGLFHGMPCGRDRSFDKEASDGSPLYAVTY